MYTLQFKIIEGLGFTIALPHIHFLLGQERLVTLVELTRFQRKNIRSLTQKSLLKLYHTVRKDLIEVTWLAYQQIPSLSNCILVAQDSVQLEQFSR